MSSDKQRKHHSLLIIILLLSFVFVSSSSLNLEEKAKSSFNRVDQNHDGVLAFAEFKSFFDSLDTNSNVYNMYESYNVDKLHNVYIINKVFDNVNLL